MQKVSITNKVRNEFFFPENTAFLRSCPHCGVTRPLMTRHYIQEHPLLSEMTGSPIKWAIYSCTSCALPVSLVYSRMEQVFSNYRHHYQVSPVRWSPDDAIPDRPRRYLAQAQETLSSPDASVVMSASAIDAMLKHKGLSEGSLYQRIGEAVSAGLLTQEMSNWAHKVRLNANNPRHADEETPHITSEEAALSLEFAKAISEIIFVLPARMPKKENLVEE